MIPDFISKRSKTRLELLGWYQIVGGVAGVMVTFWILSKTAQITTTMLLFFNCVCVVLFFCLLRKITLGDTI
jgi:hypothetical protein